VETWEETAGKKWLKMAELLLSSMDSLVRSCQAVEKEASMARLE
jgi:hypothetical protein